MMSRKSTSKRNRPRPGLALIYSLIGTVTKVYLRDVLTRISAAGQGGAPTDRDDLESGGFAMILERLTA
jgi:hypothetical protein